jgi:serine/threonine protein phosphatase PrpC/predicted RNA-binding Zn-ribbon protein involved in translation (DUF1610 family)
MNCASCGAELRPNAHYCNQCGAVQPAERQLVGTPSTSSSMMSIPSNQTNQSADSDRSLAIDTAHSGLEEGDISSGRLKRPPRVLRATEDQPGQMRPYGQEDADTTPVLGSADFPSGALPDLGEQDTQPAPVILITRPEVPEPTRPVVWEDTETAETEILPVQAPTTGKLDRFDLLEGAHSGDSGIRSERPQPDETEPVSAAHAAEESVVQTGLLPPDALSWPLPVSIIIGGRYRVETVVSAASDDQDGENIYRVSDLKGYERCWSCSQEYGEGTEASDRFCRECGADMLAREYLMYERRIPADGGERAVDEAKTVPEHPVVTGTLVTQEERTFTQSSRSYRVVPRLTEPSPFPHGAHVLIGVTTDVGKTRAGERNEDSIGSLVLNTVYDSHMQPLALGIVADGLGGHVNGQDASRLAVRMVTEYILRKVALSLVSLPVDGVAVEEDLKTVLLEGALAANTALCNANDETGADMGSTLVAALLFGSSAYIINVGDSRCYLFFDGELRQITTDHSFVEQLIVSGFVAPEDRYTHPQRNQILRSLGDDVDVDIDFFEQKLKPGMRLLLCCDGLWEMVRDDEIASILRETVSPQEACDRLIESANEHGGEDNISVVVIEVHD